MYDRRAGGGEGSLACPFLALAGDRDARADVADRRHRCYAESEPAPRATAHQENYCLTTGFVGCPTFADWVRREGARVVPSGAVPGFAEPRRDRVPAAEEPRRDRVPAAEEPRRAGPGAPEPVLRGAAFEAPDAGSADRALDGMSAPGLWEDERSWASPPPWLRGEGEAGDRPSERARRGAGDESAQPDDGELGSFPRGPRPSPRPAEPDWGQAALRGQLIEPVADEPGESRPTSTRRPFDEPWDGVAEGSVVAASAGAAEAFLAAARAEPAPELPGFLASRRPPAARGEAPRLRGDARPPGDAPASEGARVRPGAVEHRAPAGSGSSRPSVDYRPDGTPRPGRAQEPLGASGSASRAARELTGPVGGDVSESRGDRGIPPWEHGRRRDAYPDLRPRMMMPRLPRLWLGLVALILAGIVLFLLPTVIPSIFTGGPGATKTPATTVAPSVSVAPTPPPAPTPQVYTVAEGDTLSGIATKFGLTVNQLVKANPQIKDPNKLAIGDQLTIPARAGSAGESAGASGAP